jgi:hypothetical protein
MSDGGQLSSSSGGDLAIALDMGCYEVLPPHGETAVESHRVKGSPRASRQACVQL